MGSLEFGKERWSLGRKEGGWVRRMEVGLEGWRWVGRVEVW